MPLLAVNHHYYRESPGGPGIHPIGREALLASARRLTRRRRPAGQRDMAAWLEEASSDEPLVVFTFDDGLREQVRAVHDLASAGVPAVCFVPTLPLVQERLLDVHRLHLLRAKAGDAAVLASLTARWPDLARRVDPARAAAQYRYDVEEARTLKYAVNFLLAEEERSPWLATTFSELAGDEREAARDLYMDVESLRGLAAMGALATHGHSHRPLATLDDRAMREDIDRSIAILRDLAGAEVTGISYPYGGPDAVDDRVATAAAEAGLRWGFTMRRGENGVDARGRRMRLDRIDCNDLERFA